MAFIVQDAHQERFENLDAVIGFAGEEQKHIYRLPLRSYLERGARFQDDATLGDGAHGLGFNEYGFDALCRLVGTNSYFLQRLSEPELASHPQRRPAHRQRDQAARQPGAGLR